MIEAETWPASVFALVVLSSRSVDVPPGGRDDGGVGVHLENLTEKRRTHEEEK